MQKFTYLRRRQGGVYYLSIRLPNATGKTTKLWRCSLLTKDHREARSRALAYLKWLIPMKDAKTTQELVAELCVQADHFILNRYAADSNDVRLRIAFLNRLLAYVLEWKGTEQLVRDDWALVQSYSRLREAAAIINLFLLDDMIKFGIHSYKESPLADWTAPQADQFRSVPALPQEEVSTPGDTAHHCAIFAIRNCGNDDEIARDYFAKYRPNAVPLVALVPERQTLPFETAEYVSEATHKLTAWPPSEPAFWIEGANGEEIVAPPEPPAPVEANSPAQSPRTSEAVSQATDPTASASPPSKAGSLAGMTLSQARDEFIVLKKRSKRGRYVEEDAGLVIQFFIDFTGDINVNGLTKTQFRAFELALMATPDRNNIPKEHTRSLHARYLYAQTHDRGQLKPISETRLKNVWYASLNKFICFLRVKVCDRVPEYKFEEIPAEAIESQERDAWTNEELLRLFGLPLFTGCESAQRYWTPGNKFVQNELYWAYVIIFATGMRHSEIGSLRTTNIVQDERGNWNFDLRPDKTEAQTKWQKRKTKASERVIPVPDMLIHLGFLERKADLEKAGIIRLFPEWKDYAHPTSKRPMPGHHFSKSWQYIKKHFDFERHGLTIYGGRHTRASWYDALQIAERTRNRLLGHTAKTVANGYGKKGGGLTPEEDELVRRSRLPIEEQIAEILLIAKFRAEFGQLETVKTWLPGNMRPKLERKPLPDAPEARPPAAR